MKFKLAEQGCFIVFYFAQTLNTFLPLITQNSFYAFMGVLVLSHWFFLLFLVLWEAF